MSMHVDKIVSASLLPDEWDGIAGSYFQRREFLRHCETYNACAQRYYLLRENEVVRAGAVVYSLNIDLLTFLKVRSPLAIQIAGIPCSVSSSGFIGKKSFHAELLKTLHRDERGLMAVLNMDHAFDRRGIAVGRTLPAIVFENRFRNWPEYLTSLRAPYRRRVRRIEAESARYRISVGPCSEFTDEEYRLYLEVHRRSAGKLEKLTAEFFRNLPAVFRLTRFIDEGGERGWVITLSDGGRYYFFLGGQEYSKYSEALYHLKLMTILRQGIELGAREIDLGQTAEIPKMRLGGIIQEKILLGRHHNPLYNRLLQASIGFLSYHKRFREPRVFKEAVS